MDFIDLSLGKAPKKEETQKKVYINTQGTNPQTQNLGF